MPDTLPAAAIPAAPPTSPGEPYVPMTRLARAMNLVAVVVPFLGLVAAGVVTWGWGFGWVEAGLLAGMYLLTILGITVGYHRLHTHRSFETVGPVRHLFAALGGMAAQGPLFQWVASHRLHHQRSDVPGDPHSPHLHGAGVGGWLRGVWHSHLGWLFAPVPADMSGYIKDLTRSRWLVLNSRLFPLWVAVGLAAPAAVGGLVTATWSGALLGFVWGGLVRVFLGHHVTFSVNSVCHLWGRRPYPTTDHSRNNFVFGVLVLGEGWHNNHHAFPTSARHGLRWWQIDVSYWVIRGLAAVGLAWKVKLPAAGR